MKVATPAPRITPLGVIFRIIGGMFRWVFAGLVAWYRDGQLRMEGERAARWDARDRIERWWSVVFYALLLMWGSAADLALPWIDDPAAAKIAGITVLTALGVFVSVILARRVVVSVTHDPWTVREMWTDRIHLAAIALVVVLTPLFMLAEKTIIPQGFIVAGVPLVTGLISGGWAATVILHDHRSKRLLLGAVRSAFGGSEVEWARSRFDRSGKVVTIKHAPAAAFSDLRASEQKLSQVAPDWQVDGDRTSASGARLTLVRVTDETRASRDVIKRSEGLVTRVSEHYHPGSFRYDLAPGTSVSAYPRADALAMQDFLRIVEWNPAAGFAIAAPLDRATATLRDAAAAYLRVQPYEIEMHTETDDRGRIASALVTRFPKTEVAEKKRAESWLAIFDAETQRDENEVWLLDSSDSTTMVWNLREDPLAATQPYPWDAPVSMDALPFAVDDHGAPVALKLYESNILVGGIPGSGKSGGSTAILAGVARLDNVALYGIDLKRVELTPWLPRFEEIAKTSEAALDLLKRLQAEMEARYVWLEASGFKKLSPMTFTHERPLIVLVIDELAQLVLGGDKNANDEVKELLRQLVALGRAAGVSVVTMTQKPETAVIPSAFRDLLAQRVAFATTTRQMTDTVLGDGVGANGGDAHLIPQSLKGVNFLTNEESREPRRTRAYWVPDEDVAGVAERTAHLRIGLTLSGGEKGADPFVDPFADDEVDHFGDAAPEKPFTADDDPFAAEGEEVTFALEAIESDPVVEPVTFEIPESEEDFPDN